ncbi:MAG: arginase family protein [Desulfobacterota bacterium]|nr:arginase family protein [Thermodesulfobacteriota bacterium]
MLSHTVRILNFDNSLLNQPRFLERFDPAIVDCTHIGPSCRLWTSERDAARIRAVLAPEFRHSITLTGSGDFHHVTSLLLEQFTEPLSVIVFDNHPDWDILPPRRGCGSWVSAVLRQQLIEKMVLIGIASNDLHGPALHCGNLQALSGNRVEVYPWEQRVSRVFFRHVPVNGSMQTRKWGPLTTIVWQNLKQKDPEEFAFSLAKRLSGKRVYISIDKDCLLPAHALTNWEAGSIGLDVLLRMLRIFKEHLVVAGVDITGEYSPPVFTSTFKRCCARFDHPRRWTAENCDEAVIAQVNEQTNLCIVECLLC